MAVPSKTFQTKNGYITSSATSSNMYPTPAGSGPEYLIDDPRFKTNADRVTNRDQIYCEEVMRTKTRRNGRKSSGGRAAQRHRTRWIRYSAIRMSWRERCWKSSIIHDR